MIKKSKNLGKSTSVSAEIQTISHQGIWILINDKEFFMPFKEFPWFLQATVEQIYDFKLFHNKHLHWPRLDIDIDLASLQHPDSYPLTYS